MNRQVETTTTIRTFLSFRLGQEVFAVGVEEVIEILEVPKITLVPKAPAHMKGVINLRGNVLPLIDTCIKFGLPPIEFSTDTCIIIMDIQVADKKLRFGILVDSVLEVLEIPENQIAPPPTLEASYNLEFIKGILKVHESFIMILDIEKAFSVEEINLLKVSKEVLIQG